MNSFLIWSYVVLWAVVALQGAGLLCLYYYQGRAVVTDLSRTQTHGPEPGTTAPVSRRRAIAGNDVELGGSRGHMHGVLFTSTTCRACELALQAIARMDAAGEPVDIAVVCHGNEQEVGRLAKAKNLPLGTVISDATGAVAREWDIVSVPFLVCVGADGRVTDRGNPSSGRRIREMLALAGPRGHSAPAQVHPLPSTI
jgi:hypothetical protein